MLLSLPTAKGPPGHPGEGSPTGPSSLGCVSQILGRGWPGDGGGGGGLLVNRQQQGQGCHRWKRGAPAPPLPRGQEALCTGSRPFPPVFSSPAWGRTPYPRGRSPSPALTLLGCLPAQGGRVHSCPGDTQVYFTFPQTLAHTQPASQIDVTPLATHQHTAHTPQYPAAHTPTPTHPHRPGTQAVWLWLVRRLCWGDFPR